MAVSLFGLCASMILGMYDGPLCRVHVLTAEDPAQLDRFGEVIAVSPSGDRVFVSAPRRLPASGFGQGAVDVYRLELPKGLLSFEVSLNMPLLEDGPNFGIALAALEDELVIGAPGADPPGNQDAGRLFVAKWIDGNWSLSELPTPVACPNRQYASSVAALPDRLLVCQNGCFVAHRVVVIYERDRSTGQWEIASEITAPSPDSIECFGNCLNEFGASFASCGDTIVVGAPGGDTEAGVSAGQVFLYQQDAGGDWRLIQRLTQPDAESQARFGQNMLFDGEDTLYVVAGYWLSPSPGKVIRFRRGDDGSWVADGDYVVTVHDPTSMSAFGHDLSLSMNRDRLVIAAPGDRSPGEERNGLLYEIDLESGSVSTFRYVDDVTRLGATSVRWLTDGVLISGEPAVNIGSELRAGRAVIYDIDQFVHCWHDLDRDGMVERSDVVELLRLWNTAVPEADLDCSGSVGFSDLLAVLSNWGECLFVPPGAP